MVVVLLAAATVVVFVAGYAIVRTTRQAGPPSVVEPLGDLHLLYRQAGRPDLGGLFGLLGIGVVAYVFAGFVVLWLVTGSGTVGEGDEVSNFGQLIWFGPVLVLVGLIVVGPRGRLAAFWFPPGRLAIERDWLGWDLDGRSGRVAWTDVRSIRGQVTRWTHPHPRIKDRHGRTVGHVPAKVVGPDQVVHWTLDLVLEARPDLFERVVGDSSSVGVGRRDLQ